jgi:hypothetical protein
VCGPRRRFDVACMLCVLVLIMIVWILMIPCSPLRVGVIPIYPPVAAAPRNAALANSLHAPRHLLRRDVQYVKVILW